MLRRLRYVKCQFWWGVCFCLFSTKGILEGDKLHHTTHSVGMVLILPLCTSQFSPSTNPGYRLVPKFHQSTIWTTIFQHKKPWRTHPTPIPHPHPHPSVAPPLAAWPSAVAPVVPRCAGTVPDRMVKKLPSLPFFVGACEWEVNSTWNTFYFHVYSEQIISSCL